MVKVLNVNIQKVVSFKNLNKFILLCLLFIFSTKIQGLNQTIEFENEILFRGQNSLTVFSISQDSSRYIWIGTNKGLFRYDGITYKRYIHRDNDPNSIFSNIIFRTNVDPQGVLWISGNGVFARYDALNDSFQSYYLDSMIVDYSVVRPRTIYDIVADSSSLWVGLMAGAVYRFDKSNESFTHILSVNLEGSPGKRNFNKISLSKSNQHIYCTIYNKIFMIDMKSFLIDSIALKINDLSSRYFYPSYVTKTKNLWIGNNKLEIISISNNTITKILSVNRNTTNLNASGLILEIQEDIYGNLWIATTDHGLVHCDTTKGVFTYSIDNNSNIKGINKKNIGTVFIDNTGTIWVGAPARGLFKSVKSQIINNIESISDGDNIIPNDNILFMNRLCNDTALCFIDKEGLFTFSPDDGQLRRISSNSKVNQYIVNLSVNNMVTLKNRYVWFGTEQGLIKLDLKTNQIDQFLPDPDYDDQKYGNNISALTIIDDSTIWLGTYTGALLQFDIVSLRFVRRFNPEYQLTFKRLVKYTKYEKAILSIEKDSDNKLWIGTSSSGLGLFDINEGNCTKTYTLGNSNTQSIYPIDLIKRDSNGDIWIAARTFGFYKYDKINDGFIHYFDEEGLVSNNITSITEDSIHQLWLGTRVGLVLFDKQTDLFTYLDTTSNFMCYDKTLNDTYLNSVKEKPASHGISHFPVTLKGLTLENGTSIFYGPNGISYFRSDLNNASSPIMLSDFKIFSKSQKFPIPMHNVKNIEMSYKDYIFSFEYRIIDYNDPKKNKYAFWLEGFEKEWNYTNNGNKVTYFNIPPGKYIMKAKGYNSVGIWNEKPIEINITITPPFWRTWLFRIIVGLSVAGLVGFAFWFRIHQIQEQKRLLEVQVRQRTNELHESNEQLIEEIQFRKKAEEELRKSEEEYRDLFENAYDVIWISDNDGNIQAINHFFQQLLGYTKDDIIGKNLLNFVSDEHQFRAIRNYVKFKRDHLIECELNFKTRDSGIRILWLKIRGIYENGNIIGIHGIGRDSTELKITQAELQEAEWMKRESMKQLTLKLAHEIKNPLTSITSSAQLVASSKDTRENPKIQRHMNIINKNVNICNHVIRELYSFTHKPDLNLTVIQIPGFITDLRSYAENKIENNPLITIKTTVNESVHDILGDKFRLEQAFSNIINNAFDAMPETGTLTINANSADDTICIEISDTGCGMSEETIQNIFKPFYTLKASGFGLGMPVVKDIVEAHQGSINIISKPGQGSTFSICLNAYHPKQINHEDI